MPERNRRPPHVVVSLVHHVPSGDSGLVPPFQLSLGRRPPRSSLMARSDPGESPCLCLYTLVLNVTDTEITERAYHKSLVKGTVGSALGFSTFAADRLIDTQTSRCWMIVWRSLGNKCWRELPSSPLMVPPAGKAPDTWTVGPRSPSWERSGWCSTCIHTSVSPSSRSASYT